MKKFTFSFLHDFSSFTYLNITQFLGALNDNIYKLLIIFFFIQMEGIEASHRVMALTGATFVLPFLLFSAFSGTLADRFSKRDIIVTTKTLEVVIMALGVIPFAFESPLGCYAILFLLATQSAIFGPSKYGIVPELVARDKLSRANGLMTSFTFFAIILGTFLASLLLEITSKNFILCAIFCTFVGLIGVVSSFLIPYTPPSGSEKKFKLFFLKQIYQTLKTARCEPLLLPAMIGSAFFLFIGAFAQLNIIPFAVNSLGLSDVQGGYLFFLTALGIGVGALIAGKISGKIVELALVPIGAFGIAISAVLLDVYSSNLSAVLHLVTLLGVFGGLFNVPLDSYIQVASPKQARGEMFATTNFLSFIGVLLASVLIYITAEVFHLSSARAFSMIGILTFSAGIIYAVLFFDYMTRFFGMLLSRIHFKTAYRGRERAPECPTIYVANHSAWNDTLLLLGAQRRRLRFFIEKEQEQSSWFRWFYRLLRVVFLPSVEPLHPQPETELAMRKALERGFSICIFVDRPTLVTELKQLELPALEVFLNEKRYPIIPVKITKESPQDFCDWIPQSVQTLLNKIHVPATVTFGPLIYAGHDALLALPHEHELAEETE